MKEIRTTSTVFKDPYSRWIGISERLDRDETQPGEAIKVLYRPKGSIEPYREHTAHVYVERFTDGNIIDVLIADAKVGDEYEVIIKKED